jgi:putative pyruvate formate lyase activating enzyme
MSVTRRAFLRHMALAGGAACLGARPLRAIAQAAPWRPAYAQLGESELAERVAAARERLEACDLCPRQCGVNRLAGKKGFCQASDRARVYSHAPHFGEELPLVGRNGSGTIFFSQCNLRCVFCQNWPIAHEGRGRDVSDEGLARMMLDLQRRGCHNINVVTPTHVMPNILGAIQIASRDGLRIPVCYNTSGYELAEIVELLDGIVDIYLPDLKFMDPEQSARYATLGAPGYPEHAQASIIEMHRQVGDVVTDRRGVALRGLMVRHLVMPNRVAGSKAFVEWVAANLSKDTYVNIMAQYRVEFRAFEHERIARGITSQEFLEAIEWAEAAGLRNLDERSLANAAVHRRRLM